MHIERRKEEEREWRIMECKEKRKKERE